VREQTEGQLSPHCVDSVGTCPDTVDMSTQRGDMWPTLWPTLWGHVPTLCGHVPMLCGHVPTLWG